MSVPLPPSLSLFANMGAAETRSPPNCQSTLDNRPPPPPPPLRGAAALVACLLVLWPLAASANILAENLREKMHTDYLSGDAGEQTMRPYSVT